MPSFTFSKSLRLLTPSDFKPVFDQATSRASHQYFMFLASSNGLSIPRLGLVIAKKNIKHAVQRNRIKRLVREAFRHFQHELSAIDCVFLTRRGLDQLDNETITKQLMQQLKRLAKKAKETSPS